MAAAKRTAQITVHTEGGENIKPQNRQIHYRRFEMDAIFEDFVFPNISNNQSLGEHGGHLWAERGAGRSFSGKIYFKNKS